MWWTVLCYMIVLLLAIGTISLIVFAVYLHQLHKKYDHIPGPPRDSFWLGNGPLFYRELKKGKIIAEIVLELVQQYGHTLKIIILNYVFVFTVDPQSVKEIQLNHPKSDTLRQVAAFVYGTRCLGTGLGTEIRDDAWAKRRGHINPAFSKRSLAGHIPQLNQVIDSAMDRIAEMADGKTKVCLLDEFQRTTLDALCKTFFGKDLEHLKTPSTKEFIESVTMVLEGIFHTVRYPLSKFSPFSRDYRRRVRNSIGRLRKTGENWIHERRRAIAAGDHTPEDLTYHFIKLLDDDKSVPWEEVMDDFMTIFPAGVETTSSASSLIIMEIGRHPHVLSRLREEIDTVLGKRPTIESSDLGKLNYLNMVFKETLRLYPPATNVGRQLATDTNIGGFHVPAKTDMWLSSYVSSRMPEFFEDPLEYRPERFSPDADVTHNVYTYFPFTLGSRVCIGQNFAKIESAMIIAKFLQRFNFELDPEQSFNLADATTIRAKDGVLCTLSIRD